MCRIIDIESSLGCKEKKKGTNFVYALPKKTFPSKLRSFVKEWLRPAIYGGRRAAQEEDPIANSSSKLSAWHQRWQNRNKLTTCLVPACKNKLLSVLGNFLADRARSNASISRVRHPSPGVENAVRNSPNQTGEEQLHRPPMASTKTRYFWLTFKYQTVKLGAHLLDMYLYKMSSSYLMFTVHPRVKFWILGSLSDFVWDAVRKRKLCK